MEELQEYKLQLWQQRIRIESIEVDDKETQKEKVKETESQTKAARTSATQMFDTIDAASSFDIVDVQQNMITLGEAFKRKKFT